MMVCFSRNRSYKNEGTGDSFRNSYAEGQKKKLESKHIHISICIKDEEQQSLLI